MNRKEQTDNKLAIYTELKYVYIAFSHKAGKIQK